MAEENKSGFITCSVCHRTRDSTFIDCPFCDKRYQFVRENASKAKLGIP